MKFIALSIALFVALFPLFASARQPPVDIASQVIHHSVTETILALMNVKEAGACIAPVESDIQWMCTGLIKPVTKPEINGMACGFQFKIACPSQTAVISGSKTTYFLNSPKKTSVQPVEAGIQFSMITIK